MSVAFTRDEDHEAAAANLLDRPVSPHPNLVTPEGLSQLDLRGGNVAETREQSYAFAITKHGLFGDDALGLSLSQPAPSMAGSFASLLGGGSDLPPLVVGRGQTLAGRSETDFQLGYVTNFLDGAVALQTNAAYQMNVQGKTGASSVSLLSRAKIKF